MVLSEVVGDRLRAGQKTGQPVVAVALELSPQLDDRSHDCARRFVLARTQALLDRGSSAS